MQYDYVVTLKKESARKTDLLSFSLLFFSMLAFLYVQIRNGFSAYGMIAITTVFAGLCINLRMVWRNRDIRLRLWLFAAGLFWIGMPFLQWMLLPFFVLGFLEVQAKRPLEIAFYAGGLVINAIIKKKIAWAALESVILKDGLLTLDFRNNRLYQKEIQDDGESDATDEEFNEYCRANLVNLR